MNREKSPPEPRERVAGWLRRQAGWCADLGSPLYASILERAADDVAGGGPVWSALAERASDPADSALALRLMGAVHRLVLTGRAPGLAAHYPSAGGSPGPELWAEFRRTVAERGDEIRELVTRPVQTNEVGRAGALVGGFLLIARASGRPLRILEAGASAGLNLRWDHFRYEARGATWGDPSSPVRLCDFNSERPLPFDVAASVIERAGCDRHPVDATIEDGRLTLMSYVWADQAARFRALKGAIEVARQVPARVDEASAPDWLEPRLARPRTESRPSSSTRSSSSTSAPTIGSGSWLCCAMRAPERLHRLRSRGCGWSRGGRGAKTRIPHSRSGRA